MALQETLREEAHFDPLLDACPMGVLLLDDAGRIRSLNRVLQEYLGVDGHELLGRSAHEVGAEHRGCLFEPQETFSVTPSDQEERWLRCWSYPLSREAGSAAWIHYYLDVTEYVGVQRERDRLAKGVEELNTMDPLTGLMNRRSVLQTLDAEVSRSRRYHNPLSLGLLAIQAYPPQHPAQEAAPPLGEAVVRAVSGLLKDQLRWADAVGRLDDQRFLMVFPETHGVDAAKLAEKLTLRVRELKIPGDQGRLLEISARCGVAEWCQGDDRQRLLERVRVKL